jgi:hypothetical protein
MKTIGQRLHTGETQTQRLWRSGPAGFIIFTTAENQHAGGHSETQHSTQHAIPPDDVMMLMKPRDLNVSINKMKITGVSQGDQ